MQKKMNYPLLLASFFTLFSLLSTAKEMPTLPLNKHSFNENELVVTTILNNEQGDSYFSQDKFGLKSQASPDSPYNLGRVSNTFPAGKMVYRESVVNKKEAGWHVVPSPYGRLIIYITGKYRITTGSQKHPISKEFSGGDVLYFNDTKGVGHKTEVLEKGVALMYDFSEPIK